ncbi:MAG: winged helix-turn-helix domain-containing protein [Promethearchaeota archaeon]
MSNKENFKRKLEENSDKIQDSIVITSPPQARALLHDDKKKIVTLLIENKAMTIQQLSMGAEINPGTIKRHLDSLIAENLVFMIFDDRSEYNVKMKYYSAVCREFLIDIHIPEKNKED